MAGVATNVDHTIAEMIRGIKVPDACAQAKQAINAAKAATEGAKAIRVDTTGIDAATERLRATEAQAMKTLEECKSMIERANAITPADA